MGQALATQTDFTAGKRLRGLNGRRYASAATAELNRTAGGTGGPPPARIAGPPEAWPD